MISPPIHIDQRHWDEWAASAVAPDLIALNLESISGQMPYQRLLYNWDSSGKVQPDAINREINRRFGDNWSYGGWWCSGRDVATGELSRWGCFKPHRPRIDKSKGFIPKQPKTIKYEHPVQTPTEIFCLKVSWNVGFKIAARFGCEPEYQQRFLQAYGKEEIAADNIFQPTVTKDFLQTEDIGFWRWVVQTHKIVAIITEGCKKAASLLSQGYVAIAVPGVWSGIRQPKDEFGNKNGRPYLIPQLQVFAQEGRQIYLAFDQDTKQKTIRNVNAAITQTASLFSKEKCKVAIVSWDSHLGKGCDDLIVNHGAEAFHKAFESALPFELWAVKQLAKLTYSPDLEVDYAKLTTEENGEYVTRFQPPTDKQLICLKSQKNTAKTENLACWIKPFLKNGGKILLLTHRIQLGEALCQRFGINYVTELRESDTGKLFGYGLCVDSLHGKSQARFNPKDWEGAWIVVDECEQVFWHLLNSSTCQSERVEILRYLQETIQIALSTGGKIFLSDADLSDISINYVQSLAGFKLNTWIVVNHWKPEKGWDIKSYPNTGKNGQSPKALVADLIIHIAKGGIPFICTSGQKKKSKWGTQILESYLQQMFPDKKILRIDRESIADPQHPAYGCIANLDAILPQYDIVLASPTIETGVSIDCHHFTSVWGIFQGIQTPDSVRQALARVRDSVPRSIWVKKFSINRIGNGSASVKSLLASQHKLAKYNMNLLMQADFLEEIDADFQPQSLHTWAKKAALVNLGMANYSQSVLAALIEEGHTVNQIESIDESASDLVRYEINDVQEVEYQAHNEAVSEADSIVDEKSWVELKEKRSKTLSERLILQKGELERLYHVPVTPELIKNHDDGWHSKIRLHYFLTVGRQYLSERDVARAKSQLEQGSGAFFKPDFNRSQLGLKVWLFEQMKFTKLLEKSTFKTDDPDVTAIGAFCKSHPFEIKSALGLSVNAQKDSDMAITQRLAELLGLKFPCLGKQGGRGQQTRIYGAAAPDFQKDDQGHLVKDANGGAIPIFDSREEVFSAWIQRDGQPDKQECTLTPTVSEMEDLCSVYVTQNVTVGGGGYINRSIEGVVYQGGSPTGAESSQVEELSSLLPLSDSSDSFAALIQNLKYETVEAAIYSQDSLPRRQQLTGWWDEVRARLAVTIAGNISGVNPTATEIAKRKASTQFPLVTP